MYSCIPENPVRASANISRGIRVAGAKLRLLPAAPHPAADRTGSNCGGFGVFFVKLRKGRAGRNPRTGALVSVGSTAVPFFRSGKEMKSLLNAHGNTAENGNQRLWDADSKGSKEINLTLDALDKLCAK